MDVTQIPGRKYLGENMKYFHLINGGHALQLDIIWLLYYNTSYNNHLMGNITSAKTRDKFIPC